MNLQLPTHVQECLDKFVDGAKKAFASNLSSVVLFGSAAEAKLRASSDVNLILVLKQFQKPQVDAIRDDYRTAHAAIQLSVMFLLEHEIEKASETFAVKFMDILHRRKVLFGRDPFEAISVSRESAIYRLRQVLMNVMLRLREKYALVSLREEQLPGVIADFTGPIRASAASIVSLEEATELSPKDALQNIVRSIGEPKLETVLNDISTARETLHLDPGKAESTLFGLIEIVGHLQERVNRLR